MTPPSPSPRTLLRLRAAACVLAGPLAACSIAPQVPADYRVYEQERFSQDAPFSRALAASPADACVAAQRVLLGQGYSMHADEPLRLHFRKFFKPAPGTAVELAVNITCLAPTAAGPGSVVYVTAWQDSFVTKRNAVGASLGVPVMGNVSMPVATTEDALVKVSVETVQDKAYYERFFALMRSALAP